MSKTVQNYVSIVSIQQNSLILTELLQKNRKVDRVFWYAVYLLNKVIYLDSTFAVA